MYVSRNSPNYEPYDDLMGLQVTNKLYSVDVDFNVNVTPVDTHLPTLHSDNYREISVLSGASVALDKGKINITDVDTPAGKILIFVYCFFFNILFQN